MFVEAARIHWQVVWEQHIKTWAYAAGLLVDNLCLLLVGLALRPSEKIFRKLMTFLLIKPVFLRK